MKHLLLLLLAGLTCVSCTTRPKATFTDPVTGATTTIDLGGTFMAKAEGVLASAKHNGTELKYSATGEDSTDVPKELVRTAGVIAGGIILNKGEAIREETNQVVVKEGTKVKLGEQGVQKFTVGEETKRFLHSTPNPNIK